jgi:L-fuconate dehydratase
MSILITNVVTKDIRFPTSRYFDGSDAMNPDPDYSAAYVILKTDHPDGLEGHGMTFTIGRGNELCVKAIDALSYLMVGNTLESFTTDMAGFWRMITGDSQLRWLGPEKGIIHMATCALVNAVWDLYAKAEKKPLWKLVSDMSPAQFVSCIDFSYITDAISPEESIELLSRLEMSKTDRIKYLKENGYPAYTTSAGWLGYSDDKIIRLSRNAKEKGWKYLKMKVGANLEDDLRRASLIRDEIGYNIKLMMDANQRWGVQEAIEKMKQLARFEPWWIEEPTSPDDIEGHKKIAEAIHPIKVASGEHCQNRIIFKQLITSGAIAVCQIDACRIGGVNEILAVLLMAAKYGIPVCPHAGGVGLSEYVQHLSMIDYICVSGGMDNRVIEYTDHLHEHFVESLLIKNNAYMPPKMPGFSIQMKAESIEHYTFPDGKEWKS